MQPPLQLTVFSDTNNMATATRHRPREHRVQPGISIWKESLFGIDFLLLQSSPVYYGFEVPHGDGSAVIVIPGFMGTDPLTRNMHGWLRRIGYRPYHSNIGLNADCPNLLVRERLKSTVEQATSETGRKVHLIGHSLGGVIAHVLAVQMPDQVASVITLGSPIQGTVVQRDVFHLAERVRLRILKQQGERVQSKCYTPHCRCEFSRSLFRSTPASVAHTAIYTRQDGVVDWHYCLSDDPANNFEVPGTHLGLLFNQSVYRIIGQRLGLPQDSSS